MSSVWAALRWEDPYPVDYQPSCSLSLASQKKHVKAINASSKSPEGGQSEINQIYPRVFLLLFSDQEPIINRWGSNATQQRPAPPSPFTP